MTLMEIADARLVEFPITAKNFHYPSVLKCVYGLVLTSVAGFWTLAEKEDIACNVTLLLHGWVSRGYEVKSLTYVYRTINNQVIDLLRKSERRARVYKRVAQLNGVYLDTISKELYKKDYESVADRYDVEEDVMFLLKWAFPLAWLVVLPDSPKAVVLAKQAGLTDAAFKSALHRQRQEMRVIGQGGLTWGLLMRHAVKDYERNRRWREAFPEYFPEEEFRCISPYLEEYEIVNKAEEARRAELVEVEDRERRERLSRKSRLKREAKVKVPGRKRGRPKKGDSQSVPSSEGNISREAS